MERARRKLRICLICVVFAAVTAGLLYYYSQMNAVGDISEGTFVWIEDRKGV